MLLLKPSEGVCKVITTCAISQTLAQIRQPCVIILFICALFTSNPCVLNAQADPCGADEHRSKSNGISLELDSFYETSKFLPASQPGNLIRSAPSDDYELTPGVSVLRMLYHSVSPSGADVAGSGVILFPDQTAPAKGWPILAWAHPFLGTQRTCAPSLMRNLHSGPLLSMYVNLGFAVVAPDYVGLGTAFPSASLDWRSDANDLIYAVAAARQALPQLGQQWLAIGYGDGGSVALVAGELEAGSAASGYLGSVAVSSTWEIKSEVEDLARGTQSKLLAALASEIKTVSPNLVVSDILAPNGCLSGLKTASSQSLEGKITYSPACELKPGWNENQFIRAFLARNTLGLKPARQPFLVISGDANQGKFPSRQAVARMCAQGDRVEFDTYGGVPPGQLMGDSAASQISWIKARFSGSPVPGNCR
jgi:pimeloyl-ACP methyl ester carboxylesterase